MRVYVDNIIVTVSSLDVIDMFKAEMKLKFEMRDLGSLSSYLGVEVKHEDSFIFPISESLCSKDS